MTHSGYTRTTLTFAAVWFLAAFALVVSAPRVDAQVLYGTLIGTIQDESGAVVPGATVTIASRATGVSRETTVNAAGQYSIPSVPAGVYDLTVTAAGFVPIRRRAWRPASTPCSVSISRCGSARSPKLSRSKLRR